MSLTECLREDIRANRGNTKGSFIVVFFRLANAAGSTTNAFWRLAGAVLVFLYKIIINWLLCVDIDHRVTAGPGLRVFHGQGLVVNGTAVLGHNVTLRHNTTIGNKAADGGSPVIDSGVDVGANSVLLGSIHIGSNVVIGAGSVVVHDVLDGDVVAGNPAHSIRQGKHTS